MYFAKIFRVIILAVVTAVVPDVINDNVNDLAGGAIILEREEEESIQENSTEISTRTAAERGIKQILRFNKV